jgi:hypothetical protein
MARGQPRAERGVSLNSPDPLFGDIGYGPAFQTNDLLPVKASLIRPSPRAHRRLDARQEAVEAELEALVPGIGRVRVDLLVEDLEEVAEPAG